MSVNVLAVVLASVAQFIVGMIWYGTIFGKTWGKIHGFDKLSKEEQQKAMRGMGVFYVFQFLVSLLTSWVLAVLMGKDTGYSPYMLAFVIWLGFLIPTHYSNVIFGGTGPKWIVTKLAILIGGSLVFLMVAAAVLQMFA